MPKCVVTPYLCVQHYSIYCVLKFSKVIVPHIFLMVICFYFVCMGVLSVHHLQVVPVEAGRVLESMLLWSTIQAQGIQLRYSERAA